MKTKITVTVKCPHCNESWDNTTPGFKEASISLLKYGYCIACNPVLNIENAKLTH